MPTRASTRSSRAAATQAGRDTTHEEDYSTIGGDLDGPPLDPQRVTCSYEASSGLFFASTTAAAFYQPQIRAGEQLPSPSKLARGTISGRSRGYCFAFNSSSGCHDRDGPYMHCLLYTSPSPRD